MDDLNTIPVRHRLGSLCLFGGAVLFALATAKHPPEFDPADPSGVLAEGMTAEWILVHWALFAAIMLLGIGLAAFHRSAGQHVRTRADAARDFGTIAAPFAILSFVLWVLLFVFEATAWPVLAEYVRLAGGVAMAANPIVVLAHALWVALLGTGYVAALAFALAAVFWGRDSRRFGVGPSWFGWTALIGGVLAVLATPFAWLYPNVAMWILLPWYGPLGLWILACAWLLWRGLK